MDKTSITKIDHFTRFTVGDRTVDLHIPFESLPKIAELLNKLMQNNGIESYIVDSKESEVEAAPPQQP